MKDKKVLEKKNIRTRLYSVVAVAIFVIAICSITITSPTINDNTKVEDNTKVVNNDVNVNSTLKISYIDVGQADCILIQNNNKNMLIDAGNNEDGNKLVKYFNKLGIVKFDILIGTHPHEDHIGGLDDIILNFDIDKIYMPKVLTTTKTFEDVLDAIDNKGKTITSPKVDDMFMLGDCNFTVICAQNNPDDLNACSIVLRLDFGNNSFLFTGDATQENEKNMSNVDVQVLKVGHHGSKTSTSADFLDRVSPQYAIISVGEGNSYGHPTNEILKRLEDKNVNVYRTDKNGTIVFTTDGKDINIDTIKTDTDGNIKNDAVVDIKTPTIPNQTDVNNSADNDISTVVYVTKSGKKYHTAGCRYLSDSKIQITLQEAVKKYSPCSVCKPEKM